MNDDQGRVTFPPIDAGTEKPEKTAPPGDPWHARVGIAIVGVGLNSQNMGDPGHWRLTRALAGGGSLPDVGLYCINQARFLSGEEPVEVIGHTWSTPGDARFTEVEESCQFTLRFPSGFIATCSTAYSAHKSQM